MIDPVAIGGVGGSGTRLVALILRQLGFYMGGDLNDAMDNLWFTLLFKRAELFDGSASSDELRWMVKIFANAMTGRQEFCQKEREKIMELACQDRPQHTSSWLRQRAASILSLPGSEGGPATPGLWGWKEPNTHIFMVQLSILIPGLRYIHVMRNGLDMAHSSNQNQQRLWGPIILGRKPGPVVSPDYSLKYWCSVHHRILAIGNILGPKNFYLLNFDEFCAEPGKGIDNLLKFLGRKIDGNFKKQLMKMVNPPASLGRFKKHGLECFDPDDVDYVGSLGFDCSV
jgi:hypothetical protein